MTRLHNAPVRRRVHSSGALLVVTVACLVSAAAKDEREQRPRALSPGDTVFTQAGTELYHGDELIARLDEFVELKVVKISDPWLYCRVLSGDGVAYGWVPKVRVKQHPLALQKQDGVLRFVLCRVANREKDAIKLRDESVEKDAERLLQKELGDALRAHSRDVLPRGASKSDLDLIVNRLTAAAGNAVDKIEQVKKFHNQLNAGYVLYGAYLFAEIKHDDLLAAVESDIEKLAGENSWDAEKLKAGVSRTVSTLDTALGGYVLHASGRFREKPFGSGRRPGSRQR